MLQREGIHPARVICTLKLARYLDKSGAIPQYNLQYLRYYLELNVQAKAHYALGDITVLEALFRRIYARFEADGVTDIDNEMVRISNAPILLARMPFGKHKGMLFSEIPRDYLEWLYSTELPDPSPSRLHIGLNLNNDLSWKIIVPLQFLLKRWGDANQGHQGYIHTIIHNVPKNETFDKLYERQMKDEDSYYYVGITGRNWLKRLSEHVSEIHHGSRKSFHRAWRESMGMKNIQIVSSLMAINMTYDDAMNWEEKEVDRISSDQYGLNMISGGYKGLKYLHKLGITSKARLSLNERERAIEEYIR